MGYTHYWTPSKKAIPAEAIALLTSVLEHGQRANIIETQGDQALLVSEEKIWFNGVGDNAHETFGYEVGGPWEFCKTRLKPYDLYVCSSIIILKYFCPDMLFSSDGGLYSDEWFGAVKFLLENKDVFSLEKRLVDSLERIREEENDDLFLDFPLFPAM